MHTKVNEKKTYIKSEAGITYLESLKLYVKTIKRKKAIQETKITCVGKKPHPTKSPKTKQILRDKL